MKYRAKIQWWCSLVVGVSSLLFHLGNISLGNAMTTDSSGEFDARQTIIPEVRCCAKHEKMMDVGEGVSREVVTIDIGECRKVCPRNAYDDPGDTHRPAVQRCDAQSSCYPVAVRLDRVSTSQGVKVIEAINTCDCIPKSPCRRESLEHLIHWGTPYQGVIDVGVCMGTCGDGLGCRPLKNTTVSVCGPNGMEVYQTVEKCQCAGECHRMDHTETVLDFEFEIRDGRNTTELIPVVKEINVGRCVGFCRGNKQRETCILRHNKDPHKCISGVYCKDNCISASFDIHEYRTLRGARREIIGIAKCACV